MFRALSSFLLQLQTALRPNSGSSLESQLRAYLELECFFFFPSTSLLQHFQLIPECCHSGKNYVPPYIYIIHVYHWSKLGLKTPLAKIKCVSSPSQEWKEDVSIACHTATHLTETGPRATRKQKAWLVYKRP